MTETTNTAMLVNRYFEATKAIMRQFGRRVSHLMPLLAIEDETENLDRKR